VHEAADLSIVLDDQDLRNVFDRSPRYPPPAAFTRFLRAARQFVRKRYPELHTIAAL
jgi:hypothetical protein